MGLQPGPLLFSEQPDFVWGLIGSMYIGNVVCVIAGLIIIPFLMSILRIPRGIIAPMIVMICIVGAYSVNNNMFDVWFMIGAGAVAFVMNRHGYPIAPILLAFVLAPRFEQSIRRAFSISHGSVDIFLKSPIASFLLVLTLFSFWRQLFTGLFRNVRLNVPNAAGKKREVDIMWKLGVIADDFTGATDIAGFLAANGVATIQVNGFPWKISKPRPAPLSLA